MLQEESEALAFNIEKSTHVAAGSQALSMRRQAYSLLQDQAEDPGDTKYSELQLFRKLLCLNKKEWWVILLGAIGAAVTGAMFPLFSVMFGGVFEAFVQPKNLVLLHVHPWAGSFILIAAIAGVSVFVKVRRTLASKWLLYKPGMKERGVHLGNRPA